MSHNYIIKENFINVHVVTPCSQPVAKGDQQFLDCIGTASSLSVMSLTNALV